MNKANLSNKARLFFSKLAKIKLSTKLFFAVFLVVLIIAIVTSPEKYISVALEGILIWGTQILPALFPFMIFTKLLVETGYVKEASRLFSPMTKKLYRSPGISSYVFLMSILSGYPLGAKLTSDLYSGNYISRAEAHRIVSFTSNSGPMFIVGTVGVGMLLSKEAGYIILISHILAAIINGLLYRNYSPRETATGKKFQTKVETEDFLTETMMSSISSCLLIGGYITIFFIVGEVLLSIGIFSPLTGLLENFGIESTLSNGVIIGLFEMTNGCLLISASTASLAIKTALCSLLISFGGLAISFQAFAFLKNLEVSKKFYLLQKISHALLTFLICLGFGFLLL